MDMDSLFRLQQNIPDFLPLFVILFVRGQKIVRIFAVNEILIQKDLSITTAFSRPIH